MARLSELRPSVASEARDCPNPVIDRALVDAARELCEAAAIWRTTFDVDTASGAAEYPLASPVADSEIVRVIEPWVCSGRRSLPQGAYHLEGPRRLVMLYEPVANPLTVHVQLRPTRAASDLPDVLIGHDEALQAGALARLLRMRHEPWADLDLSMYYARTFRACRTQAIADVTRESTSRSAQVRPRRFAFFRN